MTIGNDISFLRQVLNMHMTYDFVAMASGRACQTHEWIKTVLTAKYSDCFHVKKNNSSIIGRSCIWRVPSLTICLMFVIMNYVVITHYGLVYQWGIIEVIMFAYHYIRIWGPKLGTWGMAEYLHAI